MKTLETCNRCGGPLADGRCRRCDSQLEDRFVHRELLILAVLVAGTVAAFFGTRSFAASNQALQLQDARTWYTRGEHALQEGDAQTALAALRRATAKDPDAPTYRLALSSALIAARQDDAARQVLMDLREQQPEDADTNLQLARLEARQGDRAAVGRYYQAAIIGLWKADQRPAQRQARTEFVEFLLNHGERDRALSELLVLEAGLPADVPAQLAAGRMLLAAGDARRAGDHFAEALRLDPTNRLALAGAGESSFVLGDYPRARLVFDRLGPDTEHTNALRTLTNLVLGNDALAPHLQMTERRRRLAAGVAQLIRRLDACQSSGSAGRVDGRIGIQPFLEDARELEAALGARNKPNSFDDIESGFDMVYRGERAAERACGSPDPFDRALVLIGRRHGLEDQ